LHQATADQAFTNAKAAGNVTGQADALMYAALERNTGGVGVASVICNETAVNPEIEAVQQHQDPASTGAAAHNKAVVLALAKELAAIGADPQEALLSGTFAPGSVSFSFPFSFFLDILTSSKDLQLTLIRLRTTLERVTLAMSKMMNQVVFSPKTSLSTMPQPPKSVQL